MADCISEAISTDTPRLRWLVGQGAERNIANRAAWGDEGYRELWQNPDNDAFMRQLLERALDLKLEAVQVRVPQLEPELQVHRVRGLA